MRQGLDFLLGLAPAGIRLAAQHAESRARCIDEHAVCHTRIVLTGLPGIEALRFDDVDAQPAGVLFDAQQLVIVDIACHDASLVMHQSGEMRRLAARGRTAVEHEFSGLRPDDMRDQHGAFILYLAESLLERCEFIESSVLRDEQALRRPAGKLHHGS